MNPSFEFNPLSMFRLFRSAGSALFAQIALHGKLANVEWAEEKNRLLRLAIATILGLISALCLLLLVSMVVIALSWNTPYQLVVIAAVLLIYVILLVVAIRLVKQQLALGKFSFAATREEIAADLALLKAKL